MLKKKVSKICIPLILSLLIVMSSLLAFTLSPLVVSAATQATYYISPSGNDSSLGTIGSPFQTITKARDIVRTINSNMTGDIYIYLRGGDYRISNTITFEPQDSGTNGYRIYYQAYPGETPVLNGATKVTGWTQYNGDIYMAKLDRSTKLRYLWVNDQRAQMTKKTVKGQGEYGTYTVTKGQADWAWTSGTNSDGVKYNASDVPEIASNQDDLEIVNGSTWNENIVCTRDVITSSDGYRVLRLQQPYGAMAQLPGWGAGFTTTSSHTIYNAFEFLNFPGQFYFNKTTKTLYYYKLAGENMNTADVEAPVAEKLIDITGKSNKDRVKNITFQGITFANTDWNLVKVGDSYGKTTCQSADAYIGYYNGNWHDTKYTLLDTYPGMININSSDSINLIGNIIKHSGADGISTINDVINSTITGNYIYDITSSGITVGHPQHVYLGDGGEHQKYASGVEGICTNDIINNNMLWNCSTAPGFGGCAAITAFFVDSLQITYNTVHTSGYNGITLGWGWCNFLDSTTCKNNVVNNNRLYNCLNRLHDSGAIYTIGQMPNTTINQNYVNGIPNNSSGPTYGLHNDEGSAYITENDNVLDINPGVTYTINCEDYGKKHDLTILRTYATVNKMGKNPPNSTIDVPVAVSDNVWPLEQYNICLNSGIQEAYRSIIPRSLFSTQDYVFPASCSVPLGTGSIPIRSSGNSSNIIWFAPSGTTNFVQGATMTKAAGTATSIVVPTSAGTYKLYIVDSLGNKLGESTALLRVSGSSEPSYKLEAEKATLSGGAGINTNHLGYSGTGFVDGYTTQGATTTFNLSVPTQGSYNVDLRYAAGRGISETVSIYVNGTKIKQTSLKSTSSWDTWGDKIEPLTLKAGSNTIVYKYDSGDSGWINIDYISNSK